MKTKSSKGCVGSLEEAKNIIIPLLRKGGATKAGVFGSFARGDLKQKSDIDILVEISDDVSLLKFIHLKHELEDSLGRRVDLVEYKTIKPLIRDQILSEEIPLI